MSLIFPVCAGAAVAAPTIVPVVLGRQWASAVPTFQMLCLVAVLDASFHLPSIQLEVFARFRYKFILQVCFGLFFGVGAYLVAPKGGVVAVATVYAFLQAFRTFGLHLLSARSLGVSTFSLLKSWIPGVVCSAFIAVLVALAQHGLAAFTSPALSTVKLGVLISLSAATLVVVYRFFYRESVYSQWKALFQR